MLREIKFKKNNLWGILEPKLPIQTKLPNAMEWYVSHSKTILWHVIVVLYPRAIRKETPETSMSQYFCPDRVPSVNCRHFIRNIYIWALNVGPLHCDGRLQVWEITAMLTLVLRLFLLLLFSFWQWVVALLSLYKYISHSSRVTAHHSAICPSKWLLLPIYLFRLGACRADHSNSTRHYTVISL